MADIKGEDFFIDDNINDIFERKIKVGAVIQFNLLQRLIEEFIKRQKSINDKVSNLEIKINAIQSMPIGQDIIDNNPIKYFDESPNINFDMEKDLIMNKKTKEYENDNNKENNKKINGNNEDNSYLKNDKENINNNEKNNNIHSKRIKDNKNIKEYNIKENEKENSNNESKNSNNSDNQYKKLHSRIDKLEVMIKEISKKILNSNFEGKVEIGQLTTDISYIKRYDDKIKMLEKNIFKINEKLKEYNIIDFLNKESKDHSENEGDKDNEKSSMIKMLVKKIELMENKGTEHDENIFKLQKEVKDINNLISMDKNNYNEFVKEVYSSFNEFKIKNNNDINNIKKMITEKNEELKNELNNNIEQNNKKIKDMIFETSERNSNNPNNNSPNYIAAAKVNNEKLNNMNIELKNFINKSISDTEKYLKSIINNLGIDNLRKDLINLHQEMNDKLSKPDLNYIDIKLSEFETKLNNQNLKIDMIKKDVDICNDTCTKSVKMIEYLSGQVVQAYQPDLEQAQREEMVKKLNAVNPKDLQSFINQNEFDKEIKNIYKKIEQTLEVESENYKFIQHIESRLKFFVTQNELRSMEQCLMNLIEEQKNEFSRKFMEKSEITKNLKILELQIKNIYEGNPNLFHIKEGDNWLLAKKPLNYYLCASCESYIGDLKNKNIYLPWNKIPSHDSKKYRMGNGFSRMLQLVNMDLMKSAEKVNNNLTIKIDDKKNHNDILKQLPRIGSQISMRHLNHPNSTFSLLNNDNLENRLNNSADGFENLEEINKNNNNFKSNSNNIQEIDEQEKNMSKNNDKENSPKVVKIVKKQKIEKKQ